MALDPRAPGPELWDDVVIRTHRRPILDAADSYRRDSEPENRLTEILAEVLRSSPQLVARLAMRAFDEDEDEARTWVDDGNYQVSTQARVKGGERPDLQVEFTGAKQPRGRLFCENKIRADWTPAQLKGYPSIKPPNVVVFISPDGECPPVAREKLTWNQLARDADATARRWESGNWRELALSPSAPSEYRMLAELVRYLEREDVDVNVPGPLTSEEVRVFPQIGATVGRTEDLFQLIAKALRPHPGNAPRHWQTDELNAKPWTGWALVIDDDPPWPALRDVGLEWAITELLLAPEITWDPVAPPDPAFGVGVTVPTESGWPGDLAQGKPLRTAIEATEGVTLGTTYRGRRGRVFATRLLRDVARDGKTLDAQAEHVAQWTRTELDKICAIVPQNAEGAS